MGFSSIRTSRAGAVEIGRLERLQRQPVPAPVRTVRSPRRSKASSSEPSRPTRAGPAAARAASGSGLEEELAPDPVDHGGSAGAVAEVGEDKRPISPHAPGVALHHAEVGADVGREVDLVDHEQVRARDAGPALARDLVALGHVDHVDRGVDQLGAERRGQVVAAALDEQQLEPGKARA